MKIDDARAALDAALGSCLAEDGRVYAPHWPSGHVDRVRAAVWPIIEGLMTKHREDTQSLVDDCVAYRNLAICLGAKPEQMRNRYDQALARNGIDDCAEDNSYQGDAWDEIEALEAKLAAAEAARDTAVCDAQRYIAERDTAREKLTQAEALLQKRPHIVVVETTPQAVFEQVHGFTFRTFHEEDTCICWGGACAK